MSGEVLAGYLLEERIGVGGMAEVYRARRRGPAGFDKPVAVKRVLPDLARDPHFVRLFLEEARLAAQLSSPGLVQVFDFGEEAGAYYLVMELCDGVDLGALLAATGPLAPALAVHVARQLAATLGDVHRAVDAQGQPLDVVHRDVTPGNILVGRDGHVKLGDFGVAKARARGVRTARGALKGKLAYLAPEQVRGDEVDARTDLYGVGLVLFEALTGARYLAADDEAGLLRAALTPELRAPSALCAGVPPALDAVVRRALAPEPERRYPTAALLEEALAACGVPLGAAEARRQLGLLVERARWPAPAGCETVNREGGEGEASARRLSDPQLRAGSAGERAAPRTEVLAGPPGTQVLAPGAPARRRRWPLVAGGAGLVVAAVGLGLAMAPAAKPPPRREARGAAPARAPAARAPEPARPAGPPAPAARAGAWGANVESRESNPSGGPQSRHASAFDVRPSTAAAPPGAPAPPAAPPAAALAAARARLDAVTRTLAQRGVRRADAPALFAARGALAARLARGEVPAAALDDLAAQAAALRVDRAFIAAKLERLNRRLAARALPGETQQRLRGLAQEALSRSLTGSYDQANRALNEIASIVEP